MWQVCTRPLQAHPIFSLRKHKLKIQFYYNNYGRIFLPFFFSVSYQARKIFEKWKNALENLFAILQKTVIPFILEFDVELRKNIHFNTNNAMVSNISWEIFS
jgi:hypothetical protein